MNTLEQPIVDDSEELKREQLRAYLEAKNADTPPVEDKRAQLVEAVQNAKGPSYFTKFAAGWGGVEPGDARKDAQSALDSYDKQAWQQESQARQRQNWATDDESHARQKQEWAAKDASSAADNDPNSALARVMQQQASKMMPKGDFSGMGPAQLAKVIPSLQDMYSMEQAKQESAARASAAQAAAASKPRKQSVAAEALDRDYAKQYNSFTQKGAINARTAIDNLEKLAGELEEDTGIFQSGGGAFASVLPDSLRSRDAIRRRDQARNFANTTLKELFGGIISDSEREAAAKEYYNDALSNEENAKIIRNKIQQLREGYDSEVKKANHFQQAQTLEGYDPNLKPATSKPSFPRTVTNAQGQSATVSNEAELAEAQAEGFN